VDVLGWPDESRLAAALLYCATMEQQPTAQIKLASCLAVRSRPLVRVIAMKFKSHALAACGSYGRVPAICVQDREE
jgi:hypothetical protein